MEIHQDISRSTYKVMSHVLYRFPAADKVRSATLLRATSEIGIKEIAFSKIIRRHRDYINIKDLKKMPILAETDCEVFYEGYKKCCDLTDAPNPSGGRSAYIYPPVDLKADMETLKTWASALRYRQKLIKA